MPTINEMRQAVLDAYPNASMSFRERMATTKNTRQIVAIYKKLNKEKPKEPEGYHQMDIFEWGLTKAETGNTTQISVKE